MAEEKKPGTDRLPSVEEWIAGGARNPDDFDQDECDEPKLVEEQVKSRQKRKPD